MNPPQLGFTPAGASRTTTVRLGDGTCLTVQGSIVVVDGAAPISLTSRERALLDALARRGHTIAPTPAFSSTNSIQVMPDGYVGAADRRTRGSLAAGY